MSDCIDGQGTCTIIKLFKYAIYILHPGQLVSSQLFMNQTNSLLIVINHESIILSSAYLNGY